MVSGAKPFKYAKPFWITAASVEKKDASRSPLNQMRVKTRQPKIRPMPIPVATWIFGPFQIACTDDSGKRRTPWTASGSWDQHCKVDNFTGDTIAGGGFQAEAVDKGAEGEERNLGQKFLQGERKSDA